MHSIQFNFNNSSVASYDVFLRPSEIFIWRRVLFFSSSKNPNATRRCVYVCAFTVTAKKNSWVIELSFFEIWKKEAFRRNLPASCRFTVILNFGYSVVLGFFYYFVWFVGWGVFVTEFCSSFHRVFPDFSPGFAGIFRRVPGFGLGSVQLFPL